MVLPPTLKCSSGASGRPAPADAPKIIEIFEVADQTASAKLTAWWGIDYLLLGNAELPHRNATLGFAEAWIGRGTRGTPQSG